MLYNFLFFLLLFLNFWQPILLINSMLEKMDKFRVQFQAKFVELEKKIKENGIKDNLKNQQFFNAMFKKEFPEEIVKAKMEVEKYLQRKITFEEIFNVINNLKLEGEKLEALKELEMRVKNALKREQNVQKHKAISKQLDLVNFFIRMHNSVNKFVDGIILELRIRQPINDFLTNLANHLKEQKAVFEKPYEIFVKKYSHIFPKIEKFIKTAKDALQKAYKQPNPPLPKISIEAVPELAKDWRKLKGAIFNENLLLEKIQVNTRIKGDESIFTKISQHFAKISGLLNETVDKLFIEINANISSEQKRKFALLHAKMDGLQSLNIACHKMLNRIEQLVNRKANGIEQSRFLADMNWLAEFIEEKLAKMNGAIHGPIYNIDIAMVAGELPKELEINGEMEPKKKAILIAQNMLFITAQLGKWHNLEDAIFDTYMAFPGGSHKEARLHEMIEKDLPSKNIGQFFYQKYEEMVIKISENEQKSEAEMSAKNEHNSGSSSSANLGEKEKDEIRKGKQPSNGKKEKEEGLKFLVKNETIDKDRI